MKTEIQEISTLAATKPVRLPQKWPHTIRCGDVAVKICKNQGNVRGENFQSYVVSYYANGKRQFTLRPDEVRKKCKTTVLSPSPTAWKNCAK